MDWIVTQEEEGERLVNFAQAKMGAEWSRRQVKALIDAQCCRVNGMPEKRASLEIKKGDRVELRVPQEPRGDFWLRSKSILHEDEQLLVLDKPAGIVADDERTLEKMRKKWPGLTLVHRLDKNTTGVWLMAKNEAIARQLEDLFREHKIEKHYLAIVDRVPHHRTGRIEEPIAREFLPGGSYRWKVSKEGKPAVTEWKMEKKGKDLALISCYPLTGRTHQLRLHLKFIGHPILGDVFYTRKFTSKVKAERCFLHARSLKLPHPVTKQELFVVSHVPQDMLSVIETCMR